MIFLLLAIGLLIIFSDGRDIGCLLIMFFFLCLMFGCQSQNVDVDYHYGKDWMYSENGSTVGIGVSDGQIVHPKVDIKIEK